MKLREALIPGGAYRDIVNELGRRVRVEVTWPGNEYQVSIRVGDLHIQPTRREAIAMSATLGEYLKGRKR